MDKETSRGYIERIYEDVAKRTVKMMEKEKATKISKKTQKMIALTRTLYYDARC